MSDFEDIMADADARLPTSLGGRVVRYAPEFGEAVDVTGMFQSPYTRLDVGEAGVESTVPSVFLSAAEIAKLPVDVEDDDPTITVGGVAYTVRERQPDGIGGVKFLLYRKD